MYNLAGSQTTSLQSLSLHPRLRTPIYFFLTFFPENRTSTTFLSLLAPSTAESKFFNVKRLNNCINSQDWTHVTSPVWCKSPETREALPRRSLPTSCLNVQCVHQAQGEPKRNCENWLTWGRRVVSGLEALKEGWGSCRVWRLRKGLWNQLGVQLSCVSLGRSRDSEAIWKMEAAIEPFFEDEMCWGTRSTSKGLALRKETVIVEAFLAMHMETRFAQICCRIQGYGFCGTREEGDKMWTIQSRNIAGKMTYENLLAGAHREFQGGSSLPRGKVWTDSNTCFYKTSTKELGHRPRFGTEGKESGQLTDSKRQRRGKMSALRQGLVGNRTLNIDEQNHMPRGHESDPGPTALSAFCCE